MSYKKIYAFIFALTLFFIGNSSVKANILDPSIRDSNGNVIPELNLDAATQCYTAYSYDRETMSCFSYSFADELGYKYILIESGKEDYPYYIFVLSHYNKYRTSTTSETYYYGGRYYLNESATTHLGYYYNERFSRYDFDFGVKSPYNVTVSSGYQFLGYYSTTLNGLESATEPETSYNRYKYYYSIYNDGLFMKFRYSTSDSAWVAIGGGTNFALYNSSVELDEYNHVNILYSSFDIYDYDNETIVHESDYVEIPDIKVTSHFTKLSTGAYNFGFNIMPAYKGMYFELTDLTTGQVFSDDVDDDLQAYGYVVQSDITTNKLYYLKIWNNENKETLYYSGSLQGIIDEEKPHIVADVYTIENGYNVEYYYQNTTSKNTCSYTLDNIEWITEECTTTPKEISITKNGLLGIQIINNRNDEIEDKYLLNLVVNPSEPYITFGGSMNKTTHVYTLKYNTFNYENSDNLYYSKDGINWVYLNNFNGEIDFIESGINVYFKLESSNGVIKYQTMFNLNFNINGDYSVVDTKGFFESISYVVSNGLNAIMILYHNLPQEIIIAISVMCPLILLCIAFEVWRKS